MDDLENRLGHRFYNRDLMARALVHHSYSSQNNERMEFLGDSILNFVASEYLFEKHKILDEGGLSRVKARLICEAALVKVATRLQLDKHIQRAGIIKGGGIQAMLADAVEALFAAVLMDAGYEVAKAVIVRQLEEMFRLNEVDLQKDAKTSLQERLQGRGIALPTYSIVRSSGAEHERFEVMCHVPALKISRSGTGPTRKAAEQAAAAQALKNLPR